MDYDPAHPEQIYPGLEFHPDGWSGDTWDLEKKQLCWVCGWTNFAQVWSSYASRLKIFHWRENWALWEVGHRWIIRDQANDHTLGNDYMTQEFLRNQPGLNFPLIKEMRRLSAPEDKVHITLMSRAEGVSLDKVWNTFSLEQKSSITVQLTNIIKRLQQFTSPVPKKVDGSGPLDDIIIGDCSRRPTCQKMGSTTDEWFDNMGEILRGGLARIYKTRDPRIIEGKFQELKDNFPKPEPYVLTHSDLHFSNIFIKDGKVEAIIDWERAGYYPWWVERYMALKYGTPNSRDLWNPLWADLQPEIDWEGIIAPVSRVRKAFLHCPFEHKNERSIWSRPPFCECKPYQGGFRMRHMGFPAEHQVRDAGKEGGFISTIGNMFSDTYEMIKNP